MSLPTLDNLKITQFTLASEVDEDFVPRDFYRLIFDEIGDNLKGLKKEKDKVDIYTDNDLLINELNSLNLIISNYIADAESITFILNDKVTINPKDIYRKPNIRGLHEEKIINSFGDPETVNMYKDYDPNTDTYSNLAISESRVYSRRPGSGLVYRLDNTISYYYKSGIVGFSRVVTTFYNKFKGDKRNQKSRKNLIDKARMYLYETLIINATIANGGDQNLGFYYGDLNAKGYLIDVNDLKLISKYVGGVKSPLLNFIATSVNTYTYITQEIVDELNLILNVEHG